MNDRPGEREKFPTLSVVAAAYYHQDVYTLYGSPDQVPAEIARVDPACVPVMRRELVRLLALNLTNEEYRTVWLDVWQAQVDPNHVGQTYQEFFAQMLAAFADA